MSIIAPPVRVARQAVGDDVDLMVDAGGSGEFWPHTYKWALNCALTAPTRDKTNAKSRAMMENGFTFILTSCWDALGNALSDLRFTCPPKRSVAGASAWGASCWDKGSGSKAPIPCQTQ